MLKETLFLLKEMRSQQGNTEDCVIKRLNQTIQNLEALRGERFSEPEIMAIILQELGALFSELPEIQKQLEYLASL